MENRFHLPDNRARNLMFLSLWIASVALFWRTLLSLAELSLTDERYSHLLLIPFVSACLVYWKRDLFFRNARGGFVPGALLLGAALGGYELITHWPVFADREINLLLAAGGVVLGWVGMFALCYGWPSVRAAIFPLAFLLFMVPVPSFLLAKAVYALQESSASTTGMLFRLLGVPMVQHDLRFSLPGVDIEIAEQCSGIRSSLSLFITGILASYLLLQSAWKRVLFALFTIPVAIFKNGVRIVTLSWLGVYVDPGFLHGKLHKFGGLPVSFLALAILAPVVFALRRSEGLLASRGQTGIRQNPIR